MSGTALQVVQSTKSEIGLFADNPEERRRMFLNLFQKNISEDQLALLFGICDRYGFDPMLKHVVLISQSMYVTRDGMRQYAHRTGLWDGIEELDKGQDERGKWRVTVAVFRKGCARPFVTTAYQIEHENPSSKPWQTSPYRMTNKCAELAALRMAFPVELGGAEEIGYDGASRQTNIGYVVEANAIEGEVVEEAPAPTPIATAAVKVQDREDNWLLAEMGVTTPEAQQRRLLEVHLGRATDRASLLQRLNAAIGNGPDTDQFKALAKQIATARGDALGLPRKGAAPPQHPDPGYQHHARADEQPILGGTPDERLAMLARIRAAMAASGRSEREVNAYVGAVYNVAAFEVLTAEQARELLVELEMAAAGRADSAFGTGEYDDAAAAGEVL